MEEKDQIIKGLEVEDRPTSDSSNGISPIRTYKADIAGYVKNKNVSLIDVAAEETKAKRFEAEETKAGWLKLGAFGAVALIIFAVGIVGYYLYNEQFGKKNIGNQSRIGEIVRSSIIAADETKDVIVYTGDLSLVKLQKNFLNDLEDSIGEVDVGLTKLAVIKESGEAKQYIKTNDFFSLIGAKTPQIITDYLDGQFEFFILSTFDGEWPILLFKTDAYDYAYTGALKWEKSMSQDLVKIFEDAEMGRGNFKDHVVQNRDTRVLYDEGEDIALIYSFINRKYLVITNSEAPMLEMFKRFASPRYFNE
ncbi:TPA: hypothetical protein DEW47_03380 [Patescibacteria group bacterium]|nr:MAG: hypothetical protein UT71_C0001G0015 [Parcubacteria group bacterium GW2011_GWF2_40_10]KKR47900.1 MAG: hypothetical protein UT83_C0002G0031 [Parcubacteria group bacterium GW2011_GWA2_40_143]KKR60348.1 MAG: hypothetical protein UT97_C0002G0048 [Parcubacteria group bacterium GW2011_GWC2_40_31]KKR82624.1 MAG: hypothetical protein UU28_C0007G0019 [Parcubacteria group bacterium GW2011_GWD2_40_9]HBB56720.1 hypothetical protein [Patescibacteria group bacterium]